jgi:hypothetical protein
MLLYAYALSISYGSLTEKVTEVERTAGKFSMNVK